MSRPHTYAYAYAYLTLQNQDLVGTYKRDPMNGGGAGGHADSGYILNRFSDLCFSWARLANQEAGVADILWRREE